MKSPAREPTDEVDSGGGTNGARFATIRDVAAAAGVGIATVSRALNNQGYVAADARRRVLEAASRLGYQPSQRARSMRNSRTMALGVIVPELDNPVYLASLRGVEEAARRRGYVTIIANSAYDPELERAAIDRLVSERVDGILMLGRVVGGERALGQVRARGIPVIPEPGPATRRLDRAWAGTESAATAEMAAHLVGLGHRRVGLVYLRQAGRVAAVRYRLSRTQVITQVLEAAGGGLVHLRVDRYDLMRGAAEAIADAARQADPPTAYVALSHLVAPAVLFGLASAGLELPADASFVTYGDSDWAVAFHPPLSVISHDVYAEAVQLTETLLSAVDGTPPGQVEYQAQFIDRESCAAPPARRGRTRNR